MLDSLHAVIDVIDRQPWLDRASKRVQRLVKDFYSSGGDGLIRARDFLHGVWLGHPLHPVLVDIPIGSWTAALVLDLMESSTNRRSFGQGADTAIKVGLIGAAGSAITGITDWHHTEHRPRRVGAMHAILNTTATALYIASLAERSSGRRSNGRGLALSGFLIASAAAYLGGHLVYGLKIGVDRSPDLGHPQKFTPVLPEGDLPENQLVRVDYNGIPVLLVRNEGVIYALAETCSHMGGPLAEGEFCQREDGQPPSVVCPWHGSRFSLHDGKPMRGPSTYIQPYFETRLRNGQIEIRAVLESVD